VQYGAVQRRSTQYNAVQHAMLLPTCSPHPDRTGHVTRSARNARAGKVRATEELLPAGPGRAAFCLAHAARQVRCRHRRPVRELRPRVCPRDHRVIEDGEHHTMDLSVAY
jgi:hypothetical protein